MTAQRSVYKYLKPEAIARMSNMTLVARSVVEGFISGLHKSPYHGFSVEFAEHREYVPGDELRHLDWQALGRTDKYFIKQFEEETNLRCQILPWRSNRTASQNLSTGPTLPRALRTS
jgi:uncharacterized protein (DUF58 family)